jgi:hypothetical protein
MMVYSFSTPKPARLPDKPDVKRGIDNRAAGKECRYQPPRAHAVSLSCSSFAIFARYRIKLSCAHRSPSRARTNSQSIHRSSNVLPWPHPLRGIALTPD